MDFAHGLLHGLLHSIYVYATSQWPRGFIKEQSSTDIPKSNPLMSRTWTSRAIWATIHFILTRIQGLQGKKTLHFTSSLNMELPGSCNIGKAFSVACASYRLSQQKASSQLAFL
eukprot:1159115-Pelagomonas_calceolata.AAC.13